MQVYLSISINSINFLTDYLINLYLGESGCYIEESNGKILTLLNNETISGTSVILAKRRHNSMGSARLDNHKWLKGKEDSNGWFTLKNQASGKFLTAKSFTRLTIEGNATLNF